MVHVDYFLGCVSLETGGKIIAWYHIISYVIVPFLLIPALIYGLSIYGWERQVAISEGVSAAKYTLSPIFISLASLLIIIICVAVVVISYRSVRAIETRNHTRMFEMMALMFALNCFWLYVLFIQLWLWPMQCLVTVVIFAIYYYLFIAIYSLYRTFRKEYEREIARQEKS